MALEHFAYFPGAVITAAAWDLLPKPFDDYRLLVLFATLALLPAALLFRGPLEWRLVLGAVLVCNPIAVRSAWFGQNDAPSLLLLVLAFALVTRRRFAWAAAAIAGAILLKQFAIVALPFLVLMVPREEWKRAGLVLAGVLAVGILPFLVGRSRGLLRRHRQVRRRDLQDRRLRPVRDPRPARASSRTATAATRSRCLRSSPGFRSPSGSCSCSAGRRSSGWAPRRSPSRSCG